MEMILRDIKKYSLDFKKTLPYFIDHIQCGKILSKKIIERIDLNQGIFYTFLPICANLNRIFEFTYGGIISPIPYGNQTYQIEGVSNEFHPQQVITMDYDCSQFISVYTKKNYRNFAVIENYMLEPEDPHINIKNVKMTPYANDVYYFLNRNNSIDEIYKTIRKSSEIWHSLFVLTQIENFMSIILDDETLDRICDNAKFVITGAYDGEGHVFWEKSE